MILHGPIISHMVYRQCTGMGPLAYTGAAADYFTWAHFFLHGALPMHQDRPNWNM
jgi:hypothetical protein